GASGSSGSSGGDCFDLLIVVIHGVVGVIVTGTLSTIYSAYFLALILWHCPLRMPARTAENRLSKDALLLLVGSCEGFRRLSISTSLAVFSPVSRTPCFEIQTAAVVPGTAPPCTCAPCKHTRPSSPSTGIRVIRGNGDSNSNRFIANPRLHFALSIGISLSLRCIALHCTAHHSRASAAPGVRPAAALQHTEPTHGRLTCQPYRAQCLYEEIRTTFQDTTSSSRQFCSCQEFILPQLS
ncbi:hypothetical protein LZ30DRAFT_804342, partial [Colletotrichum cereale]